MGRIGKRILELPEGVEAKEEEGKLMVKGPRGTLYQALHPAVALKIEDSKITTQGRGEDQKSRALEGLYNSLVKNMIEGVTKGFEKELEISGVGYRAQLQGKNLLLQIGYSHPVEITPPEGIAFEVSGANRIKVKGADRQLVGAIASRIRRVRKVEPYKGKGIKYAGEAVRKKAGKAAKAVGAAGAGA